MKFGKLQLAWFGAEDGAASIVTKTEARDPQITLDRFEKEVVNPIYPAVSIYRGSRETGKAASLKTFYDHFTGKSLTIPFVYPKQAGNELRLYNSQQSGFSPKAGDVWFIYRSKRRLYVGSMPEKDWRELGTSDPDDGMFQLAIQRGESGEILSTVPNRSASLVNRFRRNPALGLQALEDAGYRCQYNPRTKLFVSRLSGRNYLEAHHLVPLYLSETFGCNLDVKDNICALAPHWHRAIHHANLDLVTDIVDVLLKQKRHYLGRLGVGRKDLLEIYGCSKITA